VSQPSERRELIQDLRAHAHEAPATCAAFMRRAATMLAMRDVPQPLYCDPRPKAYTEERLTNGATLCRSTIEPHRRVKGAPCA
jgi:hypothetical protein